MAEFQKPDVAALPVVQQLSEKDRDAYQRIVAAGMKMMYAPETREQLMEAINSKDPVPKKLAENILGLMLILFQKSTGMPPPAALFPAAIELMGEAAEVLINAGQQVTQEDFHDASILLFTMLGKKLGATDQQLMQGAEQALNQAEGGAQAGGEAPQAVPQAQPQGRQIGVLGGAA